MDSEAFDILARFVKTHSGLSITPDKMAMVESRLAPIAERHGFAGVGRLARALESADAALRDAVVAALATHDTSFFRDAGVFRVFSDTMLPALIKAKAPGEPIRIWSAGCSSGQEAYSLAMLMEPVPPLGGRQVEILGSDISPAMIARASEGIYSALEVQRGLPIAMLGLYFQKAPGFQKASGGWRVLRSLRQKVRFKVFNLLQPFDELGAFDAIFCRNVLIYFDAATKTKTLARLTQALAPEGCLVLGEAEMAMNEGLEPLSGGSGIFVKQATAAARTANKRARG